MADYYFQMKDQNARNNGQTSNHRHCNVIKLRKTEIKDKF